MLICTARCDKGWCSEGGKGVRWFFDSWFWFSMPVLWHSLLSSHGHLTLFLMMCSLCLIQRQHTWQIFGECCPVTPLSLHPRSPPSLPLPQLQFIITAQCVSGLLSGAKVWNFDATSKQFFASHCPDMWISPKLQQRGTGRGRGRLAPFTRRRLLMIFEYFTLGSF